MRLDRYEIRFDREQTRWVVRDEQGVMVGFFRRSWQAEKWILEDLL